MNTYGTRLTNFGGTNPDGHNHNPEAEDIATLSNCDECCATLFFDPELDS